MGMHLGGAGRLRPMPAGFNTQAPGYFLPAVLFLIVFAAALEA